MSSWPRRKPSALERGESVPAWRPPSARAGEPNPPPRFPSRPPPVLDWGAQRITAADAFAAAQRVNEWCKAGSGEIDNDEIRLVCQWVLRVARTVKDPE